jgi:hypothetical protein
MIPDKFKEVLEERLHLKKAVESLFESEDGKVVLRYLCKISGLTRPQITTDPNVLLLRQGQQHIVLTILNIMAKDPQTIIDQITESLKNEK